MDNITRWQLVAALSLVILSVEAWSAPIAVTNGQRLVRTPTNSILEMMATNDLTVTLAPAGTNVQYAWEIWNSSTNGTPIITISAGGNFPATLAIGQCAGWRALTSTGLWQMTYYFSTNLIMAWTNIGGISAEDVTNSLDLSVSPSLTSTVLNAAGALQRGETLTNALNIISSHHFAITIDGYKGWNGRSGTIVFKNAVHEPYTNLYTSGLAGSYGHLVRIVTDENDPLFLEDYVMYDSGTFLEGTHYLAPNGDGGSLSNMTPEQIGSVWRTNEVLGKDGSTNTIIYLGKP